MAQAAPISVWNLFSQLYWKCKSYFCKLVWLFVSETTYWCQKIIWIVLLNNDPTYFWISTLYGSYLDFFLFCCAVSFFKKWLILPIDSWNDTKLQNFSVRIDSRSGSCELTCTSHLPSPTSRAARDVQLVARLVYFVAWQYLVSGLIDFDQIVHDSTEHILCHGHWKCYSLLHKIVFRLVCSQLYFVQSIVQRCCVFFLFFLVHNIIRIPLYCKVVWSVMWHEMGFDR